MRTPTTIMPLGNASLSLGLILLGGSVWYLSRTAFLKYSDAGLDDPALLRNNSKIKAYTANRSGINYPGVRVFYRRHPKAGQLPRDPAPLPLLVFVHGLSGSVVQFNLLLNSLTNCASCLAIDLPGCGRSRFCQKSWDAYKTRNLADLIETIIADHLEEDQGFVLITHDVGASYAAVIAANASSKSSELASRLMGLIAISPKTLPPKVITVEERRKQWWYPDFYFTLKWAKDRWTDIEGHLRCTLGFDPDSDARQLQAKFDCQSRAPVYYRMLHGLMPNEHEVRREAFVGVHNWGRVRVPVYLVSGTKDTMPTPSNVDHIEMILEEALGMPDSREVTNPVVDSNDEYLLSVRQIMRQQQAVGVTAPPPYLPLKIEDLSEKDFERLKVLPYGNEDTEDPTTPRDHQEPECLSNTIPPQPRHPNLWVDSTYVRGGHAILYVPMTARIVSGLVSDFLQKRITARLSLGWQLQYLSREGKWDVKNLAKWKSVLPVSKPINGIFRAMKTLREIDGEHSPKIFTAKWGHTIKDVIDISHADPVYDPNNFGSGIRYHKFPTVSKIPPTRDEVNGFIRLVDTIREDQKQRALDEGPEEGWNGEVFIGVHCHYGFNRTGYFVVSYLVERCGFSVRDAIDTFAEARPNGIRHSHFLDRLNVSYMRSL
ncbi:hypothetical protein F5Y16DRAFT_360408 [Xylariaceae sp. FL0255]|nr:hypothetical protein F5Y16DRAFT_360408 [Xylariaceae sp. FL0255]